MQIFLLYAAVVLIWGSTWSAIPFQLGVVAVEVSVAYRFGLAAVVLYLYAIAFGCYLALLRRIGASRAAYNTVLFPVVALLISTLFEGYNWTTPAFVGMLLTLAGNWLILSQRKNN